MKKILLTLYGELHAIVWILGVIVYLVLLFPISLLEMSEAAFLTTAAVIIVGFPALIYWQGRKHIAVAENRYCACVMVEFDSQGKAVDYGPYFWKKDGCTYKSAPVDIDGSAKLEVSEIDLPEENLISIIFSLSIIEAQKKSTKAEHYGVLAKLWNGIPFLDRLMESLGKEIAEKRHQLFACARLPGNEDRIRLLLKVENPFREAMNVALRIETEVKGIIL